MQIRICISVLRKILVKNLPTTQETPVKSLSQEDPLEECMATHSSILAWKIPTDRGAKESDMTEQIILTLRENSNLTEF